MTFEYRLDEQSEETQRVQSEGGVMPKSLDEDISLIKAHLAFAIATLEAADTSHLNGDQKANRRTMIEALKTYRTDGVFPINLEFEGSRVPIFVDHVGTRCAMGHLIDVSGFTSITDFVRDNDNYAKVQDIAEHPALVEWLDIYGMTAEEAALVQPSYGGIGGIRLPPASDQNVNVLRQIYSQGAEKLDDSRQYVIRVSEQTLDQFQDVLEQGSDPAVRNSYAAEAKRIVSQPLTKQDDNIWTNGRLAGPWPEPNPTSNHTKSAADSVNDAARDVATAFGRVLDAHKSAIEAWRDGNSYVTQAELRDVMVAIEGYDKAVAAFHDESGDWHVSVGHDGNMPEPTFWAG